MIFWIIFVCEKEIIEFILIVVNIFVGYYKRCAASGALLFFCFLSNTNAKMSSNQEIEGMLGILPEKYRAAFVLKHLENYTCEEISKMLKCPEGTVRVRIHRAKQMLYERFKGT